MPLYDVDCPECGRVEDTYVALKDYRSATCNDCDSPVAILVRPVLTTGPMPSKPLRLGGAELDITTPAQLREYKKKNPNAQFLTKKDKAWRDHYDSVRNKCEASSKKRGFSDRQAEKEYKRKEKRIKKARAGKVA